MAPQVSLQAQVNLKLSERGQRERLLSHLVEQLHICGWYEEARRAASAAVFAQQSSHAGGQVTSSSGEPVSDYHQVLHKVEDEMWRKMPVEVQREMYQKIHAALEQVLKK
ncbi:hypothetical protein TWF106_001621 [Orbilia oligospora]|uniref:Uncharacterized protein n=1 Tax=Orbilia oligospora TaxID=2813651 RepID=A0A6G1M1I0_ORBOL|nr:hypothetical protein TWF788_007851 [Orbilia oligospora]KAF3204103.1 hypothetical protein TWF106_001621 [Orbilia oligospora]KAF3221254.1 hypothetical protein TWF679_007952 [Orbilia oligospora]KAF3221255.1 hypothetical protein TWF679_007952 [Orbilia oligospora]KAF3230994.1 hypothetical protein TWF191_007723 [Orbilia oligospora]